MSDPIEEALKRFANAKPDPVFTAAFDTLRKGAPGLSERSCEALARSIAIKVAHGPEGKARTAMLEALKEARHQLEEYELERSGETYNSPQINAAITQATQDQGGDRG